MILDEHRAYISDEVRLSCYSAALSEVIKAGDVVVDLGTGTGIFGLLACQAGARRVYAIEAGNMIELAREIAAANGYQDRIEFIHATSTAVELPEKADLIVADQMGPLGIDAGLLEFFGDARQRLLKPGGVLMPSRLDLIVAPVTHDEGSEQIEIWRDPRIPFDFEPARLVAANTIQPVRLDRSHLLGDPSVLTTIDLTAEIPEVFRLEASMTANRGGTLHGVGGWFEAALSPHVMLTNSPVASRRISRRNAFLPIDQPTEITAGDSIRVVLQLRPRDQIVAWTVEVSEPTAALPARIKATFAHSTLHGTSISRDGLRRTLPMFVPSLSPRGRAARLVLSLCDGVRTVSEIEDEVHRRHAAAFRSSSDESAFIARTLARSAE